MIVNYSQRCDLLPSVDMVVVACCLVEYKYYTIEY